MDSVRGFVEDAGYGSATVEEDAIEAPPEIGIDERRMHVRAYNYWVSLLDGKPYPSIADLEPGNLEDFGPHSVLLDFSVGTDDPRVAYLGGALKEECNLVGDIGLISDVPKRSLLSRLTDHYLQIIANCAPIGFEAEFVNQRGHNTMYRGILMPFSSDGDAIDFIYGVINWKEVADGATAAGIALEAARSLAAAPSVGSSPVWADGPNAEPMAPISVPSADEGEDWDQPMLPLSGEAELADRLCAARDCAEAVKRSDARSRAALYQALSHAYDFALAAETDQEGYAEILADAGLKAQARAPMTPIVKLVFGADYDKARLTEFAASLSWARREEVAMGGFRQLIEACEGGLKGLVASERRARRPEPMPASADTARERLRDAAPTAFLEIDSGGEEFVLLVARRAYDGRVAIVGQAVTDQALVERALKRAAG